MKILLIAASASITFGRKPLDLHVPLLPLSEPTSGAGFDHVLQGTSQRSGFGADGGSSSVFVQSGMAVGVGLDRPQIVAEPKIMWVTAGGAENTADVWTNSTGTSLGAFLARHRGAANNRSNSFAEQFGIFAEEFLVTLEVLVSLSMYVLIGTTTASLVTQAFQCSRRQALCANVFWPISLSLSVGLIVTQLLQKRLCQQIKATADSGTSAMDGSAVVNPDSHNLSTTQLKQIFDPRESVTPESLSKSLHLPQDKAERWCKWFAGGRAELSLNMVLKKSAELKNADGATICRILFEVYDEEDTGNISQTLATEMLYNWCIGKYGAICECDDLHGLVRTLILYAKQNDDSEGDWIAEGAQDWIGDWMTREEWLRLAEKFPELFDTEEKVPPHVRYLRLLCKVRAEDYPLIS